jgi:uncharacterized protein (DUF2249 family)
MRLTDHYHKLTITTFILLVGILFTSCSPLKGTMNVEAAIVYRTGGAQPIARTKFYLIKKDFSAWKQYKEKYGKKGSTDEMLMLDFLVSERSTQAGKEFPFLKELEQNTITTVTTDFQGKAVIKDLQPDTYRLFSFTQLRSGYALWDVEVKIASGENSILIDQNNATVLSQLN